MPGTADAVSYFPLLLTVLDFGDGADKLVAEALDATVLRRAIRKGVLRSCIGASAYGGPKSPCRTWWSEWQTPQA